MGRFTSGMRSMSSGERYEMHYNSARHNLLVAIIFTVINCVLAVVGAGVYFLFSCAFPYAMAYDGAFWTGIMYSAEEYAEMGVLASDMLPKWVFFVMLVPAVIAIALYVLCWVFSKNRVGWMIAATVMFVLDTLFMLLYFIPDITMILVGQKEVIEEKQVGIEKIFLVPERCTPAQDVIRSIKEADVIIIGPGSLFMGIIPTLLIKEIQIIILILIII